MDGKSLDITAEKLAQLKAILPEIFSEGEIDFQRLKQAVGKETFVQNEHYELSWAGKSEARKEVQKQTTATLIPDSKNSTDFDNAQNVFIEGENLEVLRLLQKSYFGKVKMIYIDPPYNTGNDSFVYPDDYTERQDEYKKRTGITDQEGFLNKQDLWKKNTKENGQFHSVWLSMMYPRLYLSRNLLREDGVIFISIDDNEANNLKLLCDEVFGEENFVTSIAWQSRQSIQNDTDISVNHECILVFAKNRRQTDRRLKEENKTKWYAQNSFAVYPLPLEKTKFANSDNDQRGLWKADPFDAPNIRPNLTYEIVNPITGEKYLPPQGRCWRTDEKSFKKLLADNRIVFGKSGESKPQLKVFYQEKKEFGSIENTWFDGEKAGTATKGTKELQSLFDGTSFFDTPKPTTLLKRLLLLSTTSSDLVLDFFAGSGTTAQAVMELNEEDGGNRRFICVQMPEATDEKSEAYKAGYTTIADITRARIQKVKEKLAKGRASKMDFDNKPLPVCQNYTLAPSNFKLWRSEVEGKDAIAAQLELHQQSEKEGSKAEQMFVELCLKSGLGLNIAHSKENGFYKTEKSVWFCFETYNTTKKEEIIAGKPSKVVCLSSCFENDMDLTNFQLELNENDINLSII